MKKIKNHRTRSGRISKRPVLVIKTDRNLSPHAVAAIESIGLGKRAVQTQEQPERYRERGPNALLSYPAGPEAIFNQWEYNEFRDVGPLFIMEKYRSKSLQMPPELYMMLINAELICSMYIFQPKPNDVRTIIPREVQVLIEYILAISIWNYLLGKELVQSQDYPASVDEQKSEKQRYYAVRSGRSPGVYSSWAECKEQVRWFYNAEYESFERIEQAEQYFRRQDKKTRTRQRGPKTMDICAWTNHNKRDGYIFVSALRLKAPLWLQLFKRTLPVETPIAVADFLSLVWAIKYCKENGITGTIYTESQKALNWARGYSLAPDFLLPILAEQYSSDVIEAVEWLRANKPRNTFELWPISWGEMSDFLNDLPI